MSCGEDSEPNDPASIFLNVYFTNFSLITLPFNLHGAGNDFEIGDDLGQFIAIGETTYYTNLNL